MDFKKKVLSDESIIKGEVLINFLSDGKLFQLQQQNEMRFWNVTLNTSVCILLVMWCRSCDNASPWTTTDRKSTSGRRCSKNDSLIWNKIRAQLHGSVHPTHSVTLRGEREQENQPVRSQSARPKIRRGSKKQTWNAKLKCYWVWPPDALASFPPDPGCDPQGRAFLPPSRALPPPHPPHLSQPAWRSEGRQTDRWPSEPPEPGEVGAAADLAGQRGVWRRSPCWVCCLWLSEGREHRQDVLVIIMAPEEISVVQSFCSFEI